GRLLVGLRDFSTWRIDADHQSQLAKGGPNLERRRTLVTTEGGGGARLTQDFPGDGYQALPYIGTIEKDPASGRPTLWQLSKCADAVEIGSGDWLVGLSDGSVEIRKWAARTASKTLAHRSSEALQVDATSNTLAAAWRDAHATIWDREGNVRLDIDSDLYV